MGTRGTLQDVVDRASKALSQPVLVDDAALQPLAYSAHLLDDADEVRIESILCRTTRPEVVEWLWSAGVARAEGPMQIVGGEAIGLSGRWCVPIRSRGCLVGFLWVMAEREPASGEAEHLVHFAEEAAQAIKQERDVERPETTRHDALRQLLCGEAPSAYAAAAELVRTGVVSAKQSAAVLVGQLADGSVDETLRVLAGIGAERFARELRVPVLHAVWDDHAVCLIGGADPDALRRRLPTLARELREALLQGSDARHSVTVGVGGVSTALVGARESYAEASWAAHVAARLGDLGPIGLWDELGVFRLLHTVDDSPDLLPAGLCALLASPNADMLLETLEVYLDSGGDAQATAARLCLARGSLYYRLRRIEEQAGVDLHDGGERLALHLGLKIARLNGSWSGAHYGQIHSLAQLAS